LNSIKMSVHSFRTATTEVHGGLHAPIQMADATGAQNILVDARFTIETAEVPAAPAEVPAPVAAEVPAPVAAEVPAPVAAEVPAPAVAEVGKKGKGKKGKGKGAAALAVEVTVGS
jgi:hypothetical protein